MLVSGAALGQVSDYPVPSQETVTEPGAIVADPPVVNLAALKFDFQPTVVEVDVGAAVVIGLNRSESVHVFDGAGFGHGLGSVLGVAVVLVAVHDINIAAGARMSRGSEKFFEKTFVLNDYGWLRVMRHLDLAPPGPVVYNRRTGDKQDETKKTEQ